MRFDLVRTCTSVRTAEALGTMGGVLDRHATVRSTLADSSLRSWSVDVLRAVFEQVRAARSTNAHASVLHSPAACYAPVLPAVAHISRLHHGACVISGVAGASLLRDSRRALTAHVSCARACVCPCVALALSRCGRYTRKACLQSTALRTRRPSAWSLSQMRGDCGN